MKGLFITWNKYRHTLFYCTLLELCKYCFFFFFFFLQIESLHWANILAPFFQQHLLISRLCHILVILTIFLIFLLLLYFLWCDYCDQWSLKLLLRWWLAFFLAIRYILIKVCIFFRYNAIAHLLDCGIV